MLRCFPLIQKLKAAKMLFLAVFLAVGIRLIWLLNSPYAFIDTDTATVGLMARHILDGHFPMFFYGQYYLAPIESYIVAVFFLLFGKNFIALQLAPMTIMVGTGIVIYFLGKEFKNKEVGLWAMSFFLFPPLQLFWRSFKSQGYIPELLFLGAFILLLALKISSDTSPSKKRLYYFLCGIISGIGFWITELMTYFIAASGVFLLLNMKKSKVFRYGYIWIITFFLSGLPYWIFSIRHNFCTFYFGSPGSASPVKVLEKFFSYDLRTMLDTRMWMLYGLIFIFFLVYTLINREKPLSLLWLLLGFTIFFYILPGYYDLAMTGSTRYVTDLYIPLAIMIGYTAWWVNKKIRFGGTGLVSLLLFFNLCSIINDMSISAVRSVRNQDNFERMKLFFKSNNIDGCVTMGKKFRGFVFYSGEEVISREVGGTNFIGYDDLLERTERIAFYGPELESNIKGISTGYDSEEGFYFNVQRFPHRYREIVPGKWIVSSNFNEEYCRDAIDRDYSTWWSTETRKTNNMYLLVDLGEVKKVGKLQLFNRDHYRNLPKICRVSVSLDGIKWKEVLKIEDPRESFWSGPRLYLHSREGRCELIFEPIDARFIKILQDGEEGVHPWEINELFIYEYIAPDPYGWEKDELLNAYEFLLNKGIRFVYADFWESSKIREWGNGRVSALRPYNVAYLNPFDSSRLVRWKEDTAFIISDSNREGWEELISEFKINLSRKNFGRYWCYYLETSDFPANFSSIYWIGVSGVSVDRWMYYFKPENRLDTRFANGGILLGVTFDKHAVSPGSKMRIDYFWKLKRRPRNTAVFVYAMKEDKIVFQGDYEFSISYPHDIFRERHILKIPSDIQPGDYEIFAGLWIPKNGKRIYIKGTRATKVKIGSITITPVNPRG